MHIGFPNFGNTCGVNACIQCIAHAPPLKDAILSSTFPVGSVGEALQAVLVVTETGKVAQAMKALVRRICGTSGGLFSMGEQYDVCELWAWLTDRIHDDAAVKFETIPISNQTPLCRDVAQALHRFQQGKYSRMLESVQGSQIAVVTCRSCSYRVRNIEPFGMLSIDMEQNKKELSLSPLINRFLSTESLDDWKCDRCQNRGGDRAMRFFHMPPVIAISLKRFDPMCGQKNGAPIGVPSYLEFMPKAVLSSNGAIRYNLCSIGNHFGGAHGGHYTALCLSDNKWAHIDDDSVSYISNETLTDVLKDNKDGYLIIYARAD